MEKAKEKTSKKNDLLRPIKVKKVNNLNSPKSKAKDQTAKFKDSIFMTNSVD